MQEERKPHIEYIKSHLSYIEAAILATSSYLPVTALLS